MKWLANITAGLKALFQRQRVDREIDEELDGYLAASTAHKQSLGMSPDLARRAALIEVGSRNAVKHQVWSSRWESVLDSLLKDIRLSLRLLTRNPGFTAVALLSLSLGIGGNTAIFTLINQVLLRDLPVRNPQQLVSFGPSMGGGVLGGIDLGTYDMFTYDFARQLETNPGPFLGVASYNSFLPTVSVRANSATDAQPATQANASLVSGNFFSVLGADALLGRTISPSDETTPGSNPVVVLSYRYWQQNLSSNPAILGKTVSINGSQFAVIGVMPEQFHGIRPALRLPDFWVPITMQPQIMLQPSMLAPRSYYILHMFARRNPQIPLAQDQQWLNQQVRNYIRAGEGPVVSASRQQEIGRATVPLVSAARGVSDFRAQYGDLLKILMAVVGLVLLIACANLANFLLARVVTRQREIATRLALGSSRSRIVRQSLIESLLLSITGGVLGLGIAFIATRALIAFVSQGVNYTTLNPLPDTAVLLFTLAVSLITGLLFGLVPASIAARTGAASTLGSSARTAQGGGERTSRIWPRVLVTAQVMLSLLLLVGAGLFLRTLRNLQHQDFGFDRTNLLLAEYDARLAGYKPTQAHALQQSLLDRLGSLPDVRSVSLSAAPPISKSSWTSSINVKGYTPQPNENMMSTLNRVSGEYFQTVGISILAGRAITPDDSATSLKVAVINESQARHYFPKGDAVGRTFKIDQDSVAGPWQIVGIARDTKSEDPRHDTPERMVYIPLTQIAAMTSGPSGSEENQNVYAGTIELRTTGDPAQAIHELRAAVAAVDPNLPLLEVHTIQEQVASFMVDDTLISHLTGIFSLLALALTSIGLYGVMSYNVVRRTNEIGIRLALGAQTGSVLWMVLRESLWLLLIGLALGLPLTLAATRIIRQQLFGLSAFDPLTFATAIAVVSGMTLIAAWLPARRATRVDPMVALRCD
ncbi:MAG: ABC transporter permease [Silvibacterium sp.]